MRRWLICASALFFAGCPHSPLVQPDGQDAGGAVVDAGSKRDAGACADCGNPACFGDPYCFTHCTATTICPDRGACLNGTCQAPSPKCQGIHCSDGETCDLADGNCKCLVHPNSCPGTQCCAPSSHRCVWYADPCSTMYCAPTTPLCLNTGPACEGMAHCACQLTPPTCPPGQLCVDGLCTSPLACQGEQCRLGETCNDFDGGSGCACSASPDSCQGRQCCDPASKRCIWPTNLCAVLDCSGSTPDCVGGACGPVHCECNRFSCGVDQGCVGGVCVPSTKCQAVTCDYAFTCDPVDGKCKCTPPPYNSCAAGLCCLPSGDCGQPDPNGCVGVTSCTGTTPVCAVACGGFECHCAPGSCPPYETCVDGYCTYQNLCQGISCNDGEKCDQQDGVCKCLAYTCPAPQFCNSQSRCEGPDAGG